MNPPNDSNTPHDDSKLPTDQADLERRITAFVLGEASPFEASELERLIEEHPEADALQRFRRELEASHALLTAVGAEDRVAWKLPRRKRKQLLQAFGQSSESIASTVPVPDATSSPMDGASSRSNPLIPTLLRHKWLATAAAALVIICILPLMFTKQPEDETYMSKTRDNDRFGDAQPYGHSSVEGSDQSSLRWDQAPESLPSPPGPSPATPLATTPASPPLTKTWSVRSAAEKPAEPVAPEVTSVSAPPPVKRPPAKPRKTRQTDWAKGTDELATNDYGLEGENETTYRALADLNTPINGGLYRNAAPPKPEPVPPSVFAGKKVAPVAPDPEPAQPEGASTASTPSPIEGLPTFELRRASSPSIPSSSGAVAAAPVGGGGAGTPGSFEGRKLGGASIHGEIGKLQGPGRQSGGQQQGQQQGNGQAFSGGATGGFGGGGVDGPSDFATATTREVRDGKPQSGPGTPAQTGEAKSRELAPEFARPGFSSGLTPATDPLDSLQALPDDSTEVSGALLGSNFSRSRNAPGGAPAPVLGPANPVLEVESARLPSLNAGEERPGDAFWERTSRLEERDLAKYADLGRDEAGGEQLEAYIEEAQSGEKESKAIGTRAQEIAKRPMSIDDQLMTQEHIQPLHELAAGSGVNRTLGTFGTPERTATEEIAEEAPVALAIVVPDHLDRNANADPIELDDMTFQNSVQKELNYLGDQLADSPTDLFGTDPDSTIQTARPGERDWKDINGRYHVNPSIVSGTALDIPSTEETRELGFGGIAAEHFKKAEALYDLGQTAKGDTYYDRALLASQDEGDESRGESPTTVRGVLLPADGTIAPTVRGYTFDATPMDPAARTSIEKSPGDRSGAGKEYDDHRANQPFQTYKEELAEYNGKANWAEQGANKAAQSEADITRKQIREIQLHDADFRNARLDDVVKFLVKSGREGKNDDGDGLDLDIVVDYSSPSEDINGEVQNRAVPLVTLSSKDANLEEVLDEITSQTGTRVEFDKKRILLRPDPDAPKQITRLFQLPTDVRQALGRPEETVQHVLTRHGISFGPGARATYNAATDNLEIHNSQEQLARVQQLIRETQTAVERQQKAIDALPEKRASEESHSTFSLHVSDVSFKLAQQALAKGDWPATETIRPEEFVNALHYGDPTPTRAEKIACRIDHAAHPFRQSRDLLRISMRTAAEGRGDGQGLHLTLLLDNSGSMEREDRAQSVLAASRVLATHLRAGDSVSLIAFARTPSLIADGLPGERAAELAQLVARLPSMGGTNLEAALALASEKARQRFQAGAINRIVLLTDGAANLGDADPERLATQIEALRESGIAFDACGVGANDLNDELLEALTRKGDGRYYVLNRPQDADEGFARQLAGALRPSAKNVKVQVHFNPERVGRYRLIGYEKHRLKKEDFRNDTVDAAEMAAEESGVAVYEVEVLPGGRGPIGKVSVRFRDLASDRMVERSWPLHHCAAQPFEHGASSLQLAATAAFFGEKLKGGPAAEAVDLAELAQTASRLALTYPNQARVKQLGQMIEQARRLTPPSPGK